MRVQEGVGGTCCRKDKEHRAYDDGNTARNGPHNARVRYRHISCSLINDLHTVTGIISSAPRFLYGAIPPPFLLFSK